MLTSSALIVWMLAAATGCAHSAPQQASFPEPPPSQLPELDQAVDSLPAEMPADFGFFFAADDCFSHVLDTFSGTYIEARLDEIPLVTELILSDAQKKELYARIRDVNFLSLRRSPDLKAPSAELTSGTNQSGFFRLGVRAGGQYHVVRWSCWKFPDHRYSPETIQVMILGGTISRMISAHPAYRALPPFDRIYI